MKEMNILPSEYKSAGNSLKTRLVKSEAVTP